MTARAFALLALLLMTGGAGVHAAEEQAPSTRQPDESGPALQVAAAPGPLVQVDPPEDFAAWMQPQRTMADVYFGGRFVMSTLVSYTPATVEFQQPAQVVSALPDVLGRPTLLNHLTGPLPSHPELVCVRPGQPLCGRLEPSFIGVIFDETRFRVDVFVHPDLRAPPAENDARYLPRPEHNRPSLVQNLSANYSGSDTGVDRYSLFGHTRVGFGSRHVFSDWVSHTDQSLSLETFGYQEDLPDHQIRAGLYEPAAGVLRAMRQQPLAGVSVARSFHARLDISSIVANDIDVFLATRSQVDLLRDGRLYDSRFYESGNQRLDTSRLPAGAYTLQIRITDASGATRTLERFYVKSTLLAPPGHDIWFAEIGRVLERSFDESLPEDGGALLARGGYQHRVNSKLGIGVAGATAGDDLLAELSAVWVEPSFEAGGELFAATDGTAGWGLRNLARITPRTGVSLNLLRVWPEVDPEEDYQLIRDDVMQRSVQVNHRLGRGLLVATASESHSNDGETSRSQSIQYSLPFMLSGQDQFTFNAQLARVDGDLQGQLAVEWRRTRGNWQYNVTPRAQFRNGDDARDQAEGLAGSAAVTWNDGLLSHDDIRVTALVDADSEQVSSALLADHASQFGRGRAAINWLDTGDTQSTLTSAAFDTNLVAAGGLVAFGGPELADGAVLLDVEGAPDAAFDVLVDSQRKFAVTGSRRSVVALPPYHTYRVLLRDIGTDYVRYDDSAREATLYPGHVKVLSWKAEGILVAVGRLLTEEQECDDDQACRTVTRPLGDVIVGGTEGVTITDPDGFFQGEMLSATPSLTVSRDDMACTAAVGTPRIVNGVALLGDLVCR